MEVCHKVFPLAQVIDNSLLKEPERPSEYLFSIMLNFDHLKNEKREEPRVCDIGLGEVHNGSVNIIAPYQFV